MSGEERKWSFRSWIREAYWLPLAIPVVAVICWVIWMPNRFELSRAPEQVQRIERTNVDTAGGQIEIIDLRTGTEFDRIIRTSDGQIFIQSGWINHWGEHQIRLRNQD